MKQNLPLACFSFVVALEQSSRLAKGGVKAPDRYLDFGVASQVAAHDAGHEDHGQYIDLGDQEDGVANAAGRQSPVEVQIAFFIRDASLASSG